VSAIITDGVRPKSPRAVFAQHCALMAAFAIAWFAFIYWMFEEKLRLSPTVFDRYICNQRGRCYAMSISQTALRSCPHHSSCQRKLFPRPNTMQKLSGLLGRPAVQLVKCMGRSSYVLDVRILQTKSVAFLRRPAVHASLTANNTTTLLKR